MKRWRPGDWPDYFEMALTLGSIYSGLIYMLGPERLRSIYSFVNQFGDGTTGMQVLGGLWLAGGLLIFSARALNRPTNLRRIGHAISAGVYGLMSIGLMAPILVGGPASSGGAFIPYLFATMLHVYFGTHEPALTHRFSRGSREG